MFDTTTEYHDSVCCEDAESVVKNDVCDTYGGDETTRDVYVCKKHKRAFAEYYGGRFSGTEELLYSEYETYLK